MKICGTHRKKPDAAVCTYNPSAGDKRVSRACWLAGLAKSGLVKDSISKIRWKANKMAQQVKVFATKPDDLSSSPRADMVEGEN